MVAAVISSLIVAVLSGLGAVDAMTGPYMETFAEYIQDFFLIFLLGAIFGRLMGDTGAAQAIAEWSPRRWAPSARCSPSCWRARC